MTHVPRGHHERVRFAEHLAISFRHGITFGVFLGSFDLLNRVFVKRFEWFELYQAVLVAILISACFFVAVTVCLHAAGAVRGSREDLASAYSILVLSLTALSGL